MNIIKFPFEKPETTAVANKDDNAQPRFTVQDALSEGKSKRYYIIMDWDVPASDVNRHLLIAQKERHRSVSSNAYYICNFLNTIYFDGLSLDTVTYDYIGAYLDSLYLDKGKSRTVIWAIISALTALFEDLAVRDFQLDASLLRYPGKHVTITEKNQSKTLLKELRKSYPKRKSERINEKSVYTKWYTQEQIVAIANAFPIVDRCIFLDTVYTGHRIDTALSLELQDFDPKGNTVYGRYTKTGKTHKAHIPDSLVDLINTYLIQIRSYIVEKTGSKSTSLFLNRDGSPRTYRAYYNSMRRVEEKLKQTQPELGVTSLHTHAGRSTFLAAIRSYQLEQRRHNKETFTDADLLTLMDWRTMGSLENYDKLTREFETLPFQKAFMQEQFNYLWVALENGA